MSAENFLKQLVDYVTANTTLTLNVDLFCGLQPDSPDDCVAIHEIPAGLNWSGMGEWSVQAMSRAHDFWVAHENAYVVFPVLANTGFALVDYRVMFSRVTLPPLYIGEDESRRKLISTRFMMYFKEV